LVFPVQALLTHPRDSSTPLPPKAFTKLTQLDPEHGEGWANLAALWLQAGAWQQALSASEQAVRHKRDSWEAWENYAAAALRAGALLAAARGCQQVLALSNGRRVPLPLLVGLVEALERADSAAGGSGDSSGGREAAGAAGGAGREANGGGSGGEEDGEAWEAPAELLGLISLSQALPGEVPSSSGGGGGGGGASGGPSAADVDARQRAQARAAAGAVLKAATSAPACGPEVWGLLGRWYGLQGELVSAKEALLKQVRALQGAPFAKERPAFEAMAEASLGMAGAYLRLAASGQGGARDLAAARMHLRGVIRQAEGAFGEAELFGQLRARLAEVEAAEAAAKAAAAPAPAVPAQ
jgi:hypothetical protein